MTRTSRSAESYAPPTLASFVLALALVMLVASEGSAHPRQPMQVAQQWDDMSPKERGEAWRNYQRYRKLPPKERRAVEQNYDRWRQLPPAEKQRLRGNYERYRQLSPGERRDYQRRYERWKGKH